jgi:hypothetical protein
MFHFRALFYAGAVFDLETARNFQRVYPVAVLGQD